MPCAIFRGHVLVRERKIDVLGDGKIVEQMVALEDHADALAGEVRALLAIERVDRRGSKPVLAEPTVVEQGEHVEKRRLPCPGRTHHGDKFAFTDGEADAAQHPGFSVPGFVTAFYILHFDHGFCYSDLKKPKVGPFIPFSMRAWVRRRPRGGRAASLRRVTRPIIRGQRRRWLQNQANRLRRACFAGHDPRSRRR